MQPLPDSHNLYQTHKTLPGFPDMSRLALTHATSMRLMKHLLDSCNATLSDSHNLSLSNHILTKPALPCPDLRWNELNWPDLTRFLPDLTWPILTWPDLTWPELTYYVLTLPNNSCINLSLNMHIILVLDKRGPKFAIYIVPSPRATKYPLYCAFLLHFFVYFPLFGQK